MSLVPDTHAKRDRVEFDQHHKQKFGMSSTTGLPDFDVHVIGSYGADRASVMAGMFKFLAEPIRLTDGDKAARQPGLAPSGNGGEIGRIGHPENSFVLPGGGGLFADARFPLGFNRGDDSAGGGGGEGTGTGKWLLFETAKKPSTSKPMPSAARLT